MSQEGETFFTIIGCMDGRCQEAIALFGQERFGVQYPDTITEPGMVGILGADDINPEFLKGLKHKIDISLKNHRSKEIVLFGHAECAGNFVSDQQHKDDVLKSVEVIRTLIDDDRIKIIPLFVERNIDHDLGDWIAIEISHHNHDEHHSN